MENYPKIEIGRLWNKGGRDETVSGLGDRMWRVSDLVKAIENEPVYEIPLAFIDLASHSFGTEGGLVDFAIHMRHVNESDSSFPVIFDQWGRILDGRHRIVKAIMEGRTTIRAVRIPDGTEPTYYKA